MVACIWRKLGPAGVGGGKGSFEVDCIISKCSDADGGCVNVDIPWHSRDCCCGEGSPWEVYGIFTSFKVQTDSRMNLNDTLCSRRCCRK